MKRFSVKDFIVYNNPCFCCGERITIKMGTAPHGKEQDAIFLSTLTTPEFIKVDLTITYTSSLSLQICPKTNKFETNNFNRLKKYLDDNNIFLYTSCGSHAQIIGQPLKFNLEKKFIYSFEISKESFIITDDNNHYQIVSDYLANKSYIWVDKIDATNISSINFEFPLMSIKKFKDKLRFIEKMKTYLIFS